MPISDPDSDASPLVARWVVFLWMMIAAMLGLAGFVAGRLYLGNPSLAASAHEAATSAFISHHWTMFETDRDFRPVINQMFYSAIDSKSISWRPRFIANPATGAPPLDEFETRATASLLKNGDEFTEGMLTRHPRYMRAFRAKPECLSCHATTPLNGVVGFASLRVASDSFPLSSASSGAPAQTAAASGGN